MDVSPREEITHTDLTLTIYVHGVLNGFNITGKSHV